jgi:uncharacterized membrane protein YfcA
MLSITFLTFVSSAIGTATGFGSSTILLPILAIFYPFQEMLLFVGILHLANDLWKVILFRDGLRWDIVLRFGIVGAFAGVLGAELTLGIAESALARMLGFLILLFAVFTLWDPNVRFPSGDKAQSAAGATSGFLAGLTGIGGPVHALALAELKLKKHVYLATAGMIAIVIDIPRLSTYLLEGVRIRSGLLWGLPLFLIASFLGAKVAQRYVDAVPDKLFRKIVLGFLAVVGMFLLIFGQAL